jgi:hypothetical protein
LAAARSGQQTLRGAAVPVVVVALEMDQVDIAHRAEIDLLGLEGLGVGDAVEPPGGAVPLLAIGGVAVLEYLHQSMT